MVYWLGAAILGAVASLAAARFLTSPRWIDALFATASFGGLAAGLLVALLIRRVLQPRPWKPMAALLLALASAVARSGLLLQLAADPLTTATIDFGRIFLACATVVWGLLALLWGVLAVADATEGRTRWKHLLTGGAGVVLALYSVAPLWQLLGLRINHWTLLGLAGLAFVAYLCGLAYRRAFGHKEDRP